MNLQRRSKVASRCLLIWSLVAFNGCESGKDRDQSFGAYPIKMWAHKLDGCSISVSVDDIGNVRSDRACGTETPSFTVGRMPDSLLTSFKQQWFDSVDVFRTDLRQNNCAGNEHNFYKDLDTLSTGLYRVCGAGGELRDARGLPPDLQMLITHMLNSAGL